MVIKVDTHNKWLLQLSALMFDTLVTEVSRHKWVWNHKYYVFGFPKVWHWYPLTPTYEFLSTPTHNLNGKLTDRAHWRHNRNNPLSSLYPRQITVAHHSINCVTWLLQTKILAVIRVQITKRVFAIFSYLIISSLASKDGRCASLPYDLGWIKILEHKNGSWICLHCTIL
jgi:hypothetical protein